MFNKYWNMFINWIKSSKPSNDIDEMNETQSEMMTYKLKLDTNEIEKDTNEIEKNTNEIEKNTNEIEKDTNEIEKDTNEIEEIKYYNDGIDGLEMMEEPSLNDK